MTSSVAGFLPPDDQARSVARSILARSRFAALGTLLPSRADHDPAPLVTRVAVAPGDSGMPMMLVSALSTHSVALRSNPSMSLLLGDIAARGDALTQPRISLIGRARFLDPAEREGHRKQWLIHHPKARIYVDLPDFAFVTLDCDQAFLNGGFGRAYILGKVDLT